MRPSTAGSSRSSRSPSGKSNAPEVDLQPDETIPLLAGVQEQDSSSPTLHHGKSAFFIWTTILGVVLLITTTNALIQAPQQRILESVFCKYHYQENDPSKIGSNGEVDEIWCKLPAIHKQLASLRGWLDCIDAIPGIFLPIPFGVLADRIGRKPVLIVSLTGLVLQFFSAGFVLFFHNAVSIKWILVSPLFELIGGGASVTISTALTMIADSIPAEERAVVFFRTSSGAMVGPLIAYPIAALLMGINPYLSILVALIIAFISLLIALSLPETLNLAESLKQRMIAAAQRDPVPSNTIPQKVRAGWLHLVQSTKALLHHQAVIWLLPMFLITAAVAVVMDFLMQYASEKFFWSFRNASILPEVHTLVNALLLMFILPALSHFLTKTRNMTSARKDLFIMRICVIITISGLFLIGIAPSMPLLILAIVFYSLGGGFIPAARSILVGLVKPEQNARLFAVCGTITYIGSFISAPLLARTYGWALEKGGFWLGTPFWFTAVLVTLASIPLFTLKFEGDETDDLAITTAVGREPVDQSDTVTLVSEEAEEERERERRG